MSPNLKRKTLQRKRGRSTVPGDALPGTFTPRVVAPDYQPIRITSAMPEQSQLDIARPAVYPFRGTRRRLPGEKPEQINKYDAKGNLLTSDGPVNINVIAFTADTSSAMALDNNLSRRLLVIQNNGADFIVVNFGAAAALSLGLKIAAGQGYEFPIVTWQSIFIIGNIAGLAVIIMEGT